MMGFKITSLALLCLILVICHNSVEAKRSWSTSRSRGSSSSRVGTTRRVTNYGHTSAGISATRPSVVATKPPSYGWNTQSHNKPLGTPPPYPRQQPGQIHSQTVRPVQSYPTRNSVFSQTQRPLSSGSVQPGFYPHPQQNNLPQGGTFYKPGTNLPQGGSFYKPGTNLPHGAVYVPPVGSSVPHQVHLPSGGVAYPQQQVFAGTGVQPGFYPAGSFPVKSSSGPGFGTGLIAGALGGAVLGHVLTPTHTRVVSGPPVQGASDQDRVIIINNNPGGQPTVTNADGQPASGVTVVNNGPQQPSYQPQPNTAGIPQVPPGQSPYNAPLAPLTPTNQGSYPEGTVPLAPFPNTQKPSEQMAGNTTDTTAAAQPAPNYGVYCVPVMTNVTDPNNPSNVTAVEQVYCYNVLLPDQTNNQTMTTLNQQQSTQQPDLMKLPGNEPTTSNFGVYPTQRSSTAALADSTNIKSGSNGILKPTHIFSTIVTILVAFTLSY